MGAGRKLRPQLGHNLKSQIATSSSPTADAKLPGLHRARRHHGPNVLNSPQEQFRVEQAVSPDFIL